MTENESKAAAADLAKRLLSPVEPSNGTRTRRMLRP